MSPAAATTTPAVAATAGPEAGVLAARAGVAAGVDARGVVGDGALRAALPLLTLGPAASVQAARSNGRQAAASRKRGRGVSLITVDSRIAVDLAPPGST